MPRLVVDREIARVSVQRDEGLVLEEDGQQFRLFRLELLLCHAELREGFRNGDGLRLRWCLGDRGTRPTRRHGG